MIEAINKLSPNELSERKVERDTIALDAKPDEQPSDKRTYRSKEKKTSFLHTADIQPYDNDTKALFGQDGARIIPELIAGAEVLAAHNVEVDRSKLKVDLVFQILRYPCDPQH